MKKIILLALAALMMAGCMKRKEDGEPILSDYYKQHSVENPYLLVLDSCEYICWHSRMAHKGNCRFCKERRQKELEELVIKGEITMATINNIDNLRYQIYSLTLNGELDEPITKPILTKERAYKYFTDCVQCAIVSINEYGSIVEILEKDTTPLILINKRPKIKKRQRR